MTYSIYERPAIITIDEKITLAYASKLGFWHPEDNTIPAVDVAHALLVINCVPESEQTEAYFRIKSIFLTCKNRKISEVYFQESIVPLPY